jgi:hypothetical protein
MRGDILQRDRVTDPNDPGGDDLGEPASLSDQRLFQAVSNTIHLSAGITGSEDFQYGLTDLQALSITESHDV